MPKTRAQSRTVRASGPTESSEKDRLDPDEAADAGRQPDRSARIRTECGEGQPSADGRAGAARGTAGHMSRVPGIAAVAPVDVMAGRADGELGHVQPAQVDRTGSGQPLHHGAGLFRPEILADLRTAGREAACGVVHVLVRQRHAVQRPQRLAPRAARIRRVRLGERFFGVDVDEAVQHRLDLLDPLQSRLGQFTRGDAPSVDGVRRLDERPLVRIGHRTPPPLRRALSAGSSSAGSVSNSEPPAY